MHFQEQAAPRKRPSALCALSDGLLVSAGKSPPKLRYCGRFAPHSHSIVLMHGNALILPSKFFLLVPKNRLRKPSKICVLELIREFLRFRICPVSETIGIDCSISSKGCDGSMPAIPKKDRHEAIHDKSTSPHPSDDLRDQAGTYVNLIASSPIKSLDTRRSGGRGPAKNGLPRPSTTGRR